MKYLPLSFLLLALSACSAQIPHVMKVSAIDQAENNIVLYTVTSTEAFYTGGNIYILHIGDSEFRHSTQSQTDSENKFNFLIPQGVFDQLEEGKDVWVSYGEIVKSGSDIRNVQDFCKENSKRCWYLGTFTKKI